MDDNCAAGGIADDGRAGNFRAGGRIDLLLKLQFLVVWILGTAFVLWACAGLKRVRVDEKSLYVSNYRREISIPFAMISEITENRWLNLHPVTVHFRIHTEFGQKISFMPTARLFGLLSSHPVVTELRQLAGLPQR